MKLYLFDIEGTTTDINFVHKVLFPYSLERMENYIESTLFQPQTREAMEMVITTVWEEEKKTIDLHEALHYLKTWIKNDRKHMGLKILQGLIWEEGYAKGDFLGHVYPDVKDFFERIQKNRHQMGIYSSGSVHAQKLLFSHSEAGDLTPFLSFYFDTEVGFKREIPSYQKIAQASKYQPANITFFSDVIEELDAALRAGFNTVHVQRETYKGTTSGKHQVIKSFKEFTL